MNEVQKRSEYCQVKIIVVDGSSEPLLNANDVINLESRSCSLMYLYGIDSGPYDAMNKGLLYADGEWIWFLNSGDYAVALPTHKSLVSNANIIIGAWISEITNKLIKPSENHGLKSSLGSEPGCGLCHQSMLFRSEKYKSKKYQDKLYNCAAELEYFIDDIIDCAYTIDHEFVCRYNNRIGLSKSKALLHLKDSLKIYKSRNIKISKARLLKRYISAITNTLRAYT